VLNVVHFQTAVFAAVVDSEVVITKKNAPDHTSLIRLEIVKEKNLRDVTYIPQKQWADLDGEPINVLQPTGLGELINKLQAHEKLDLICKITQGSKPFQVGKGNPKQTRKIVEEKPYVSEIKIDDTFRPLLRGKLMNRYTILWDENYWISLGDWLAEPRYSADYDAQSKIIIRQTGDSLVATLDKSQFVVRDNLYTIVSKRADIGLHAILGVLNSRCLNWYYQNVLNPEQGEALAQVKRGHLARLPIPAATPAQQSEIEALVEQILVLKKENPDADVSVLEAEIDQLVYKLYDLTPEEVAIVKGRA
jgi:hypothetical protein